MEQSHSTRPGGSGWVVFAGVVMFIIGSLDALWGLAGILNDDILVVGGQGAIIADLTTWGWVHLILGSIIALTGLGLLVGNEAARWVGSSSLPSTRSCRSSGSRRHRCGRS